MYEHRWLVWFCLSTLGTDWKRHWHSIRVTHWGYPLRLLRTANYFGALGPVFLLCLSCWLDLCLFRRLFLRLFWIRLFFLGLLGISSVWVLYIGSCIHPRGAVDSRPMPWTRLCCSELHRCSPVVLPAGLAGAPASSTRLPTWFVNWSRNCSDSAGCLFCGWVALRLWTYYNLLLCILQSTAGLSGTMTSWNGLNSSVGCMICEPVSKRTTLPEPALLWWNLRTQICNVFGFACLSALRALPWSFTGWEQSIRRRHFPLWN